MKDYYKILGIAPDATASEIKQAFRSLAKQYHPDCGQGSCREHFQESREAYEQLIDPAKRQAYDRSRANELEKNRRRRYPEAPSSVRTSPSYSFHQTTAPGDYIDALFELFFGSVQQSSHSPFQSSYDADATLEVILSPEEAYVGVTVPIDLVHQQTCPMCAGSGGLTHRCRRCKGFGYLDVDFRLEIAIPRLVRNNSMLRYTYRDERGEEHTFHVFVHITG